MALIRRSFAILALMGTPLALPAIAALTGSAANAAGGMIDTSFGSGQGFVAVTTSDTNARVFAEPSGVPLITTGGTGLQWGVDGQSLSSWSGDSGIRFPTDAAIDS